MDSGVDVLEIMCLVAHGWPLGVLMSSRACQDLSRSSDNSCSDNAFNVFLKQSGFAIGNVKSKIFLE